ncbi:DegT/DnrJ/EryC1/StrS family aminotransferase [Nocardiopsis sp. LOL_012]|uniref:DegT/DnrJ/EryC1/StrS family aminotransferase n=1 Tax=Nocardiopsis sp. LOL_012 TaxID=3345409 RepID=UPI003A87BB01
MRRHGLDLLSAAQLGAEAAVTTVSGSAAVLAVASCVSSPGHAVLMPGWICSGVVNAVIHAGMRPVMVDIDESFGMSPVHADGIAATAEIGFVLYAPYGGFAIDLALWQRWAEGHDVPLVIDLAQTPDPLVWRKATARAVAVVSSFRVGKPLGAEGGGVVAGGQEIVDQVRLFLNGGRDGQGRKVGVGLELRMHPTAEAAAYRALSTYGDHVYAWREATRDALSTARSGLLPSWAQAEVALSRLPRLDGVGRPLHPDATFRGEPWRRAVRERLGPWREPPLPRLEALYDRVTVTKVVPAQHRGVPFVTSEDASV